MSARGIGGIL